MPVVFSGWKAYCDKSKHLKPGQEPKKSHGYIMYHGTLKTNAPGIISSGFRPSTGGTLGPGVYCSRNINKAMGYPLCATNDRVVLKLRVRVGKVKKLEGQSLNLQDLVASAGIWYSLVTCLCLWCGTWGGLCLGPKENYCGWNSPLHRLRY